MEEQEDISIKKADTAILRKEVVNIVSNFLQDNRDATIMDDWGLTKEAADRLSVLLQRNGH